jgi:hypothetical protein
VSAAEADHVTLLAMITHQIRYGDPESVELWALLVVEQLLHDHRPVMDEDLSDGDLCAGCRETWPCGMYALIEMRSHHGE